MTLEDAAVLSTEPSITSGRDVVLVTPGADQLVDGNGVVQCARWLLICGTGAVTFVTIASAANGVNTETTRTFTVVSGMQLPVVLPVFVIKVTAATPAVYAVF